MKLAVIGDAASVNVQRWCEGLADAGAAVEVISFAPAWRDDIPVRQLPTGRRLGRARYLLFGPLVRHVVARMAPDIVIGYFATGYGTLARLAARRPLVQVTAGDDVLIIPRGTLARRMATRNLQSADLAIAWAPHMADAIRRFGVPDDRILIQARGIPLDGYPQVVPATPPGPRVVVTRSLRPEYHHDFVFTALAHPALSELSLTVVGDGPERTRLKQLCVDIGIDNRVQFIGRSCNDDIPDILARHDVYVSACDRDGVSASLLEAMAAGLLPVVANHPANALWIEDGHTGLLVEPTPHHFVQALVRATTDADLRAAAVRHGPEIVRARGDLRRNAELFLERFRQLTA